MIDEHNQLSLLKEQFNSFEHIWEKDENGVEFVYARNLQKIFEYSEWRKFSKVINKAKMSCKNNGIISSDHFVQVDKMVALGSNSIREIDDIKLTRYACYLIAQNGDPRKTKIAFAQHYFAVQTRRFEKIIERMENTERIESRGKLKESEKEFGRVVYDRGVGSQDFGLLKSKGDHAFFGGHTTQDMKRKLNVPQNRALHDFTQKTVVLGKALANAITTESVIRKDKTGLGEITDVHVDSNKNVRKALIKSGIKPENMPPEPDIKIIERAINKEDKKLLPQKALTKK